MSACHSGHRVRTVHVRTYVVHVYANVHVQSHSNVLEYHGREGRLGGESDEELLAKQQACPPKNVLQH